jgi:hypothetical protein
MHLPRPRSLQERARPKTHLLQNLSLPNLLLQVEATEAEQVLLKLHLQKLHRALNHLNVIVKLTAKDQSATTVKARTVTAIATATVVTTVSVIVDQTVVEDLTMIVKTQSQRSLLMMS